MNSQAKEVIPANTANPSGEISIRVKDQNNNVVCFKLKRSTKFKRLMESYCNRNGFLIHAVRFVYDGETLNDNDSPDTLKMEDNEEIDAITEQLGGGYK